MAKKKPYQKPEIKQVNLVPEEAVLLGCKQDTGVGGSGDKCPPATGRCKTTSAS